MLVITQNSLYIQTTNNYNTIGQCKKRRNSSASALELRLFCTESFIYTELQPVGSRRFQNIPTMFLVPVVFCILWILPEF